MRQAEGFYNTTAWRKCRASYKALRKGIDGGMCEICGCEIGTHVHHKIPLTQWNKDDPDIALNFSNLQLVCHHCHDVIHGYASNQKNESRIFFDEMGNAYVK